MELLCALLTGFFLWLLVYQWRRKSITRWRHLAGGHLCTAESTRPRRVRWAFFAYFSFMLLGHVASAVFWHTRSNLESQFGVAGVFTLVLLLGIPVTRNIALEVREHGVFCGKVGDRVSTRRLHFVPWNLIAACQWVPKSFGVISRFDNVLNRLTIAQEPFRWKKKRPSRRPSGNSCPSTITTVCYWPNRMRNTVSRGGFTGAISIVRRFSSICKRCCCWWLSWHVLRVLPASATEVPNIRPL